MQWYLSSLLHPHADKRIIPIKSLIKKLNQTATIFEFMALEIIMTRHNTNIRYIRRIHVFHTMITNY